MSKDIYLSKFWKIVVLLFAVFVLTYFHHFHKDWPNPNETVRLYLAIAIAEDGRLNIDKEMERYGVVWDRAIYKQKTYSDKAPGISLVSAIPVLLCHNFYKNILHREPSLRVYYITSVLFSSTLLTLISILSLMRLFEIYGLSIRTTILSIIVLTLGTYSNTYSMLFFGHQFVSSLLFISFTFIELYIRYKRNPLYIISASFLAGFSFISEYPTILISVAMFTYLILLVRKKEIFIYSLPAVLPIILLLVYFFLCFGSFFSTGYSHLDSETFSKIHREGFVGFTYPSLKAFINLMFGSQRGIFFFSPVLLFSLLYLLRHFHRSALMKFHFLLFLTYSLFISSFGYWIGGDAAGARHLLPLNYFLIVPLAFFIDDIKKGTSNYLPLFYGLLIVSIFNIILSTASWPFFPPQFLNPLSDFVMILLREGYITHSIVNLIGVYSFSSLGIYLLFILTVILTIIIFELKKDIPSYIITAEIFLIWILLISVIFPLKPDENNFKEIIRIEKAFDPRLSPRMPYERYAKKEDYICIKRGNMLMRSSDVLEAIKEYRCR